jgi:four helix bundle protein
MKTHDQPHQNDQLRNRTMAVAIEIYTRMKVKKFRFIDKPMILQLCRSSSSVAANCRAAFRSRSDAEFFSKICIVVEECDETKFWLEFMEKTGFMKGEESTQFMNEIDQLLRIFNSIKHKMKIKLAG